MSWTNPTPEEALEAYTYHKNRYYTAASDYSASVREEQSYLDDKRLASSQLSGMTSQKLNFEKRIEGIDGIIKMMEGTGGWFSVNVPDAISKAVASVRKADASYHQSIRMSGGKTAASLETAFKLKTVAEDHHSFDALQKFKAEKAKLEQNLTELKSQIAGLSETISSLNSKISACDAEQAAMQRIMSLSALEMDYYRKRMY